MINANLIVGGLIALLLLLMGHACIRERRWRAAWLSLAAFAANLLVWAGLIHFHAVPLVQAVNFGVWGLLLLAALLAWIPWFPAYPHGAHPGAGFTAMDEREHMFSRNELRNHPSLAEAYYAAHPGHREMDAAIHAAPELGEPGGTYYSPRFAPMAAAAFEVLDNWRRRMPAAPLGRPAITRAVDGDQLAADIRSLARYYGAVDVGFADLEPHHWYSHAGRHAENWGEVVCSPHKRGIVIVVAMDVGMMQRSPSLPVLLESSRQYVECAKIANVVAQYLRNLGHDSREHTDANYQLLCVPVAVSAGLGELGRMGIFMHRIHGPCVRLSVVTTDAPLPAGHPVDLRMARFCRICKKCAENCPSRAIPEGEEPVSRGFRHWSIDQERCFGFWKRIGTDCGFCIRVCPFTKPDTLVHRMVRWLISRNPWNQRAALFFDDLLYGRRQAIPRQNPPEVLSEGVSG